MFEWFGLVSFCPHSKVSEFALHLKDGRIMGSKCKKCGSNGARIHYEEWSDGMTYSDYGCSACGFWEVVE